MAILRNGERRGQNGPARDVWRHGRDPCGDDALALVEEQALRQRSAAPSRREVLLGLGAASALAPLAACSAPRGDSAASREAAATGPTVQVEFLHSFGDATPQGDTMGRLIGSFNTSQRRVEVRSQVQTDGLNQKRLALFAAGVAPDISWDKAATFLSYADKGLLMPVGDYARRKPPQGLAMAD